MRGALTVMGLAIVALALGGCFDLARVDSRDGTDAATCSASAAQAIEAANLLGAGMASFGAPSDGSGLPSDWTATNVNGAPTSGSCIGGTAAWLCADSMLASNLVQSAALPVMASGYRMRIWIHADAPVDGGAGAAVGNISLEYETAAGAGRTEGTASFDLTGAGWREVDTGDAPAPNGYTGVSAVLVLDAGSCVVVNYVALEAA